MKGATKDYTAAISEMWGIDLYRTQHYALQAILEKELSLFVTHAGWGRTFMTAFTALLYASSRAGRKVACFSPSWSQSKKIYKEIQRIISKVDALQMAVLRSSYSNDEWEVIFHHTDDKNFSSIRSFSLGDGARICGYRANMVILDEAQGIPEDTYNTVVRPMLGGSDFKSMADLTRKQKALTELGFDEELNQRLSKVLYQVYKERMPRPKLVLFGEPTFKGSHLHKLYTSFSLIACAHAETFPLTLESKNQMTDKFHLAEIDSLSKDSRVYRRLYDCEWDD